MRRIIGFLFLLGLLSVSHAFGEGGIHVHVGGTAEQLMKLRADNRIVEGLHTDEAVVAKMRETIQKAGAYGSVSVQQYNGKTLPYIDNTVNQLTVEPGFKVSASEMKRVLKPGGVLLVVDMVAHDRDTYRHTMGHRHLGFSEKTVRAWAKKTGLGQVRYHRLRPDTGAKGPGLFVATMWLS